jgi:hypothetical protein
VRSRNPDIFRGLQVRGLPAPDLGDLRELVAQIDTSAVGEPGFRPVVTGTGPVITLDDGTVTCQLRALAP